MNEFYHKLIKEKDELNSVLAEREKKLLELEKNFDKKTVEKPENKQKTEIKMKQIQIVEKVEIKTKDQPRKSNRYSSFKPNISNEKLGTIEEKTEKIIKKKSENSKKSSKITLEILSKKPDYNKTLSLKSRNDLYFTPQTPKTEQNTVILPTNEKTNRENLDTAGKSCFIYPDSQGNFKIGDGIDKFVNDYQKKESPFIKFQATGVSVSNTADYETRSSLSSIFYSDRKAVRPLNSNRYGFPSDIFNPFASYKS